MNATSETPEIDPGYQKNWNPNDWYKEVSIAEEYDRTRFSSLAGRTFDRLEKRTLLRSLAHLPIGATIIDAPCGTGRLAEALLEAGYRVVGIDISEAMLDVAKRKLERFGDNFQSCVRDIREIGTDEFKADVVLCARVLMHFPLDEQIDFLSHAAALSKELVIFNQSISNPYHRFRRKIKGLLRNQVPASYPLTKKEIATLVDGAGLQKLSEIGVQPFLSEATFVSCKLKQ
jgi:2-polyprenyl-3-methyl-5-hydroxy-6-metoxy-1,4-benzoquinol methylase